MGIPMDRGMLMILVIIMSLVSLNCVLYLRSEDQKRNKIKFKLTLYWRVHMWKKIRILILLMILFVVAVNAYRDQNQDWNKPIFVLLHPINADGLATTQQYIQQLSAQDLKGTQEYLEKAAQQYRGQPTYFYFNLGHELKELPPKVPEQASLLGTILWSLKFRFYAWQQQQGSDPSSNVTLFLNYYDPAPSN